MRKEVGHRCPEFFVNFFRHQQAHLQDPNCSLRVPGLGVGNVDLAEDVLDAPEAAHVEHRVRVVLVLKMMNVLY